MASAHASAPQLSADADTVPSDPMEELVLLREQYAELQREYEVIASSSADIEAELELQCSQLRSEKQVLLQQLQNAQAGSSHRATTVASDSSLLASIRSLREDLVDTCMDVAAMAKAAGTPQDGALRNSSIPDVPALQVRFKTLLANTEDILSAASSATASRAGSPTTSNAGRGSAPAELLQQIAECEQQRDAAIAALAAADAAISAMHVHADETHSGIAQLASTLDKSAQQLSELQQRYISLTEDNERLRSELSRLHALSETAAPASPATTVTRELAITASPAASHASPAPVVTATVAPLLAGDVAGKYARLLQENAQLLSALFKTRTNIMVFCRVRPASADELRFGALSYAQQLALGVTSISGMETLSASAEGDDLTAAGLSASGVVDAAATFMSPGKPGSQPHLVVDVLSDTELAFYDRSRRSWRPFAFDRVFSPEASQSDVFREVAPLAQSVVEGYNACIFAYGITGSGKTHTMQGPESDPGINLRIVTKIFELLALRKSTHEFRVRVSMLEIYNEELRDLLLAPGATAPKLEIRSGGGAQDGVATFSSPDAKVRASQTAALAMMSPGSHAGVHIPLLTAVDVKDAAEVLSVFSRGAAMRATAATNIHEHSSRSHCLLKVEVEGFARDADASTVSEFGGATPIGMYASTLGKLYLVDLAGSERVRKSAVTGARLREAQYINRSLSALGDVLEALDKKAPHIPYRNSKLTHLLQDSLGGSARTLMMATVCPGAYTADESLYSLQFASRARNIDLGPAQRTVQIKNITDQYRTLRTDFAASEHAKAALEKELAEAHRLTASMEEKLAALRESSAKANDTTRKALTQRMETMKRELSAAQEALAAERKLRASDAEAASSLTEKLRKEQHMAAATERDKKILEQRMAAYQREVATLKVALADAKAAAGRRGAAPLGSSRQAAVKDASRDASRRASTTASALPDGPDTPVGASSATYFDDAEHDVHAAAGAASLVVHVAATSDGPVQTAVSPSSGAAGELDATATRMPASSGVPGSKFLQSQRERRAKREAAQLQTRREVEEAERKAKEELRKHAKDRVRMATATVPAPSSTVRPPPAPGARKPAAALTARARPGKTTAPNGLPSTRPVAAHPTAAAVAAAARAAAHTELDIGYDYDAVDGVPVRAVMAADDDFGYGAADGSAAAKEETDDETAGGTFMVALLNPTDEQEAHLLSRAQAEPEAAASAPVEP